MIGLWTAGLLRRRAGRLGAAAAGVAVAVALLASLGAFLVSSQASMTARAVRDVTVDWQVQVQPGADPATVLDTVRAAPGTTAAVRVGFGQADGLFAATGTTKQTTGAAVVLGLPEAYRAAFPGEIRTLAGADRGVLLAQQTAANLGVVPGDMITINLAGGRASSVRVAGVVELPQANSLFQTVGAPAGSQPSAPPDNVVLLPEARWQDLFAPLTSAASAPDQVRNQIHVARSHDLAADPASAYTQELGAARNLEAASTGAAVVGDNLGASLDAARSDAAYAQVLFVFLGLPGAVLAGLLTAAVATAGAGRRRQEQALARLRGVSRTQGARLAAVEAGLVGAAGAVVGLFAAAVIGLLAFGSVSFGATPVTALAWTGGAALAGLFIAAVAILAPAYRDLRLSTVASARLTVGRAADERRAPGWARYGLDVVLLAGGALLVWASTANGYQLVLAPEGVPTISVSYWAFAGPALLWIGSGLLIWRLVEVGLLRRWLLGRALRPVAGGLAPTAAAMMARRRRPMARAVVLLGLALAFAASTATFNATYQAQAEADAQLTNGADVTVTESPGVRVGPDAAAPIAAVPGVRGVEPVQHRFGYIGADLQDLYGVRPETITGVTALQDSYFQGGTARALMATLTAKSDSILVSAETVKDYQLLPGDVVNLRLQDSATKQLTPVQFHYAGIVTEFPTAPKDSFFVANASYVAAKTGSDAVGAFLVDTGGRDTAGVGAAIQARLGPSATVTDIAHTRSTVGSSLTAVDLAGLTRVELGFALALVAATGGLVLFLGLAERQRTFALATALGASRGQLRGLVGAEALVLGVGGVVTGAVLGWVLSQVLVAVLTGVFDPPPAAATVPWAYLAVTAAATVAALGVAAAGALRLGGRPAVAVLRDL
ncbi:MAG TPA: ABC transporter permease [Pseudonocardia sp.]